MNTFDGNPTEPGRSLSARSLDDKTISDSEVRKPSQLGNNPLPAAVSNVEDSAFEQKILAASPNGIYIYDLQAAANTYINPQYTRLTGYALADLQALKGAEFFALYHPQDRERVAIHMENIGRAGNDETREIEYRFKTAEGRWIWCLSRDTVFERDGQGAVRRIIGTFVDITARKTAEKKLAHECELLQTLIDTIPVMITIYDPGLQRFSFNNEFRRVLGWSEQDLSDGDPMEKFYADSSEREAARQFMASLETGWRVFKVTAKDGQMVESSWANIRLSDDTQVGIGIDIRERKRAEAKLKQVHADLETRVHARTGQLQATVSALENEMQTRSELENQVRQWSRVFMDAADPIIIENLSGTIIDMNQEAEREYGWRRGELIGKSIRSLIPPKQYSSADRLRQRCRRGEEVRNWEGLRIDQKGRIFSVLLTAFPLLDDDGKIVAVATIAKDISLRKQMEKELTASQKHLRELSHKSIEALESDRRTTAKELHDGIGASLAAIKFRLEGIVEEIAQTPQNAITSIDETIACLQNAIRETRQISAKLRPTMLDDLGLLSTIKWYMRHFLQQFGDIKLRAQIEVREEDIPETLKIVIYRVLQESLHNAAKHSEATEVAIGLKTGAHQIVLEVADNGTGFDVQKILGRQDPLNGYGLASMLERAEIVGGSLMIDSFPKKGTRIKMILPQEPFASEILSDKTV